MTVDDNGLLYDPIENDPRIGPIIALADKEAEEQLANVEPMLGYCHLFWGIKKQILKERYGIDWKTPAEMNPMVCFD